MYNRYIRSEEGSYTRIPEEEPHPAQEKHHDIPPTSHPEPPREAPPSGGMPHRGDNGILQRLLDQLHLDRVDTGDLLLLGLLFLLFREGADDEVLAALGLLLIL